jgi:methyl-accepting chemotaxis protein
MAAYAVYEYLSMPGVTIPRLILEHGWHVLAYGVVVYVALSVVLYRNVVRPVRQLNVKLYAISRGDLSPVNVESRVDEVQQIAQVVNFLLARIQAPPEGLPQSELSQCGEQLRAMARAVGGLDDDARKALIEIANRCEKAVEGLSSRSLHEKTQRRAGS